MKYIFKFFFACTPLILRYALFHHALLGWGTLLALLSKAVAPCAWATRTNDS